MFTDTHAHLNDGRFTDKQAVIQDCRRQKVTLIINAAYDLASSKDGQNLAQKYDEIYFAAGIHPSEAGRFDLKNLAQLNSHYGHEKCVAIGEIGLDYHYEGFDKTKQKALFLTQAEIARAHSLPIIIHSRDCTADLLKIIEENPHYFERCVMHCFSGSAEVAKILIKKGIYISFAGPITFKNAANTVRAAMEVPLELLLTETDCPYLAPEPYRGKQNYPYYVTLVAKKLAEIKGVTLNELNGAVRKNTLNLFEKIKIQVK